MILASHQPPATSHQPPATSHQPPATSHQLATLASQTRYLPFGPLTAFTFGNGLAHTRVYDACRLTAINDPVYASDITHDGNGNIVAQTRPAGNLDTGYDALDRLITATDNNQSLSYQYDRNGNRLLETRNGAQATYSYQPGSNRITQTGVDPVSLDVNGNTIQLRDMSLVYSPDNRLIEVVDKARYGYNALGERTMKTTSVGITSLYLYGPEGQLLAELDGNGQPNKLYAYLNGQPLAVVDNTNGMPSIYYSHNDHLGTPQALTDQSGAVVWKALYDPFGLATVNDDPDGDRTKISLNLRFPGRYLDEESGLHYNYFRDYDPYTGRYVESDPIGIFGGINTYIYVGANPFISIDPKGLNGSLSSSFALLNVGLANYSYWSPHADVRGRLAELLDGRKSEKCNFFVNDMLTLGGDPPGRMADGRVPSAREWANPSIHIAGYTVMPMLVIPKAGDVIAYDGHVGLYKPSPTGSAKTISASILTGAVVWNDWGFRRDQTPTIRRCNCDL